jgi:hypothetical protein
MVDRIAIAAQIVDHMHARLQVQERRWRHWHRAGDRHRHQRRRRHVGIERGHADRNGRLHRDDIRHGRACLQRIDEALLLDGQDRPVLADFRAQGIDLIVIARDHRHRQIVENQAVILVGQRGRNIVLVDFVAMDELDAAGAVDRLGAFFDGVAPHQNKMSASCAAWCRHAEWTAIGPIGGLAGIPGPARFSVGHVTIPPIQK